MNQTNYKNPFCDSQFRPQLAQAVWFLQFLSAKLIYRHVPNILMHRGDVESKFQWQDNVGISK